MRRSTMEGIVLAMLVAFILSVVWMVFAPDLEESGRSWLMGLLVWIAPVIAGITYANSRRRREGKPREKLPLEN